MFRSRVKAGVMIWFQGWVRVRVKAMVRVTVSYG